MRFFELKRGASQRFAPLFLEFSILILIGLLVGLPGFSLGQAIDRDPSRLVTGSGYINTRSIESGTSGHRYLFDEFRTADVVFSNRTRRFDFLVNFDLEKEVLVVNIDSQMVEIGILADTVKFKGTGAIFVRGVLLPGTDPNNLFEVLHAGKNYHLVKGTEIKIVKPTYNPALHVGDPNSKVVKSTVYFVATPGRLLYQPIKLTKKNVRQVLGRELEGSTPIVEEQLIGLLSELDKP